MPRSKADGRGNGGVGRMGGLQLPMTPGRWGRRLGPETTTSIPRPDPRRQAPRLDRVVRNLNRAVSAYSAAAQGIVPIEPWGGGEGRFGRQVQPVKTGT